MPVKVLVVDDNHLIRSMVRAALERETHVEVCAEAENGKVAIDLVKEHEPDVVILDLAMPVMNGLEAAREISKIAPQTKLAMLTSHDEEMVARQAAASGVRCVFSKSHGLAQLTSWLRQIATKGLEPAS